MASKAKREIFKAIHSNNVIELHIQGEILPNRIFLQILDIMLENKESETLKAIRFVVYTSMMLTAIRYAIPSEYYETVEVRNPEYMKKDVLKDAAGM